MAFAVTVEGRGSLVVVPATGGPELTVTASPPPAPMASHGGGIFDWMPSGDALVYVADDGLLYFQPLAGGPPVVVVAEGPVTAPAVSPDGNRVAYVRDGRHVAVASIDASGPWPQRISASPDFAFDPAWSPDGTTVAWHEWDVPAMPWDDSRIVVSPADGSGPPAPVALAGAAACDQPRFAPDGSALAFLCDASGWLNVWQSATDGSGPAPLVGEAAEHGGPSWGPGQRSYAWSPDGRSIAFCRNEAGFGRLCVCEISSGQTRLLDRGVYTGLSWVGGRIVGLRAGAKTPSQVVVLDLAGVSGGDPASDLGGVAGGFGAARRTLARGPVAGFEAAGLVEPEVVSWEAEEIAGVGTTVHGRLYRAAKTLSPLLIFIHGGPTGQNQVGWNARVAYFCDRGFSVLQVDHRGSTGWGRDYARALRGQWGRLDVTDTAAAMRAAAAQGWGDPRRMVPIGGSAGGLTVLLLMAQHAELCAAGVDLYGVTDLFDLDETTHRFEAHYLQSLVGPLPEAADLYRQRSPINLAGRITAPLLVLQGSADNVVPKAQSDRLVERIKAAGGTVDYHVYQGEGHGWSNPDVVEDELERTWAFLRRHVLRRR